MPPQRESREVQATHERVEGQGVTRSRHQKLSAEQARAAKLHLYSADLAPVTIAEKTEQPET